MIDKTPEKIRSDYLPFLIKCTKYLHEKGAKPFILIHEGEDDLNLAKKLVKNIGQKINIIQESRTYLISQTSSSFSGKSSTFSRLLTFWWPSS
jgi:colanic acid/amylovoran biosynthesis protein